MRITLSAPDPAHATLGRAEATGRITDDDLPTVTIAADSERVIEGAALWVTVTRTGDLSANLVVTIQIGPSPDTTTHTAHVTIPRGASTRRTNAIRSAPGVGADTVYYLRLEPGAGHALGDPATITVTVLDDDAPRAVSVADADAVAEGGTLAFPVTMSGPYRSEVTVNYTLGGTAAAGSDYEGAASGSVTFPKGGPGHVPAERQRDGGVRLRRRRFRQHHLRAGRPLRGDRAGDDGRRRRRAGGDGRGRDRHSRRHRGRGGARLDDPARPAGSGAATFRS